MTDIGYQDIINRIRELKVEPPEGYTVEEMQAWLLGYGKCYEAVLGLIDSFIDHSR